jgi:hypothetical protein
MRSTRTSPLLAVLAAFFMGSLSAHCAQPGRAPTAVAAEPTCPPPPCVSGAPRTPALDAKAFARIQAAKKVTEILRARSANGSGDLAQLSAAEELEFRAVRDSGIVGPDLVDAAKRYLEGRRRALQVNASWGGVVSAADVARAEYAVAEAEYWLDEAKTKR